MQSRQSNARGPSNSNQGLPVKSPQSEQVPPSHAARSSISRSRVSSIHRRSSSLTLTLTTAVPADVEGSGRPHAMSVEVTPTAASLFAKLEANAFQRGENSDDDEDDDMPPPPPPPLPPRTSIARSSEQLQSQPHVQSRSQSNSNSNATRARDASHSINDQPRRRTSIWARLGAMTLGRKSIQQQQKQREDQRNHASSHSSSSQQRSSIDHITLTPGPAVPDVERPPPGPPPLPPRRPDKPDLSLYKTWTA